MNEIEVLLEKIRKKKIWDEEPVFCFTSDIDWASESILERYFEIINPLGLSPTLFVTHHSDIIEQNFKSGFISRGIHPNFLQGSSQGSSFVEIIEHCMAFAPESIGFRSHRLFDVTDITHLLKNQYYFKYVSNLGTVLKTNITPIIHESGLIHFPVFFEDGTHLYNNLDLNISKYYDYFTSPGIKIINFHPMNFIINTPYMSYMRNIKDTLTREEYNNLDSEIIKKIRNNETKGIGDSVLEIIEFAKTGSYRIMSLNDIYYESIR